jgi:hypothetical protein
MHFNPDNQEPTNQQEISGFLYIEGEYISENDADLIETCINISEAQSNGETGVATILILLNKIQSTSLSSYYSKEFV